MSEIHEALQPIAWLAGRWATKDGKGSYPNIPDFSYQEELEFTCVGQPMFNYTSISRHPVKLNPMHQERGFLRIKPQTNNLAFVVSHNMGLTSVEEGTVDIENKQIVLETVEIGRISFAKPPFVKKFKRLLKLLDSDSLEVVTFMEIDETPLTEHLKAIYKKIK